MATPSVTGTVGSGYIASATSLTFSHTATGNPLYVVVHVSSNDPPLTVTFGGVSLTRIMNEPQAAGNFYNGSAWSLAAPTAGAANVVITQVDARRIAGAAMNILNGPASATLSLPSARLSFGTTTPLIVIPAYSDSLVVQFVRSFDVATATDGSTQQAQVTGMTVNTQAGGALTTCSWSQAPGSETFVWAFTIPAGSYALTGGDTQLWMGRNDPTTDTFFGLPTGRGFHGSTALDRAEGMILTSGTLRSLSITKRVAPGAGKSWTYTVYKNTQPTGLTVTIADLATSASLSLSVPVYPYDRLLIAATGSGTPAGPDLGYCCEFETGTAALSVYGTHILDGVDGATSTLSYTGPLFAHTSWTHTAGELDYVLNLSGAAGTLTEYAVMAQRSGTEALLVGEIFTFVLVLNGVVQDGSGGTANTTITVSYLAGDVRSTYRAQFSMALVVGDELYARATITGVLVALKRFAVAALFHATAAGEFTIGGGMQNVSNSATRYASPTASSLQGTTATESDWAVAIAPLTRAFAVTGIVARLDTAPTGVKTQTFSNRLTGTSPAGATSLVLTGATTKDTASGYLPYVAADTLSMKVTPSGTPAGAEAAWALRGLTMAPSAATTTQTIRRERIFVLPFKEDRWLFLRRLEIVLEAGVGLTTGQGSDPQLMISISRDGGETWGAEYFVAAGALGEYQHRAILYRLGRYRNGAVKIVVTDPVAWNLLAAFGDLDGGRS